MNVIVDIILYLKNVTVINRNFSYKSSKFEFDLYNTDSERSSEKATINAYLNNTLSSDSEFSINNSLSQSKNIRNNQHNRIK